MPSYTVRVELHDATYEDYQQLHKAMESRRFFRWVKSADGDCYRLPTAEYSMPNTRATATEVLAAAKKAAETVKPRPTPWVLVTKSSGRRWAGLRKL